VHDISVSAPWYWSPAYRVEYLAWTESVVARLRGTNPALEERYDRELAHTRAILKTPHH